MTNLNRLLFLLVAVFSWVLCGLPSHAADALRFSAVDLYADDNVIALHLADLDRNGTLDVAAITRSGVFPHYRNAIVGFLRGSGEKFSKTKPHVLKGDAFVADVLKGGGSDIVVLAAAGLFRISYDPTAGTFSEELLIKGEYFPFVSEPGDVPSVRMAYDLQGDGRDELLLLSRSDAHIYEFPEGKEPSLRAKIALPVLKHFVGSRNPTIYVPLSYDVKTMSYLPKVSCLDLDANREKDFAFAFDDEIWLMPSSLGKSPYSYLFLKKLTEFERMSGEATINVQIADANADGFADILVNRLSGSLLDQTLQTSILWGRGALSFDKEQHLLRVEHSSSSAFLQPLGGAEGGTLISTQFNTSVFALTRALVSKKIPVVFDFYSRTGPRGFATKPSASATLHFKIDFTSLEIDGFLPAIQGDFNGDGLVDAVVGPDQDHLSFYLQKRGSYFGDTASHVIKSKNSNALRILDINGDKRDDVLFYYPKRKGYERLIRLFLSQSQSKSSGGSSP